MTSQTLTFMPAVTRPSRSQKAMNSRVAGSPRKTTSSPGRAVARVLHADVVLVGEEVRDPLVDDVLAKHRAGRRRALLQCVGPVLDAQAPEQRMVVVGDVARREDAVGARAQRGVDEDPVVDVEHAFGQPGARGATPTPISDRVAVQDGPVARAHALGAAVALDRLDAAAEVQLRRRGRRARRGRRRRARGRGRPRAGTDCGSTSATSIPRWRAEAATSQPIHPAPTTTSRPPASSTPRSASESSSVRRTWTPSRSAPGIGGRLGSAPVASSSAS